MSHVWLNEIVKISPFATLAPLSVDLQTTIF